MLSMSMQAIKNARCVKRLRLMKERNATAQSHVSNASGLLDKLAFAPLDKVDEC